MPVLRAATLTTSTYSILQPNKEALEAVVEEAGRPQQPLPLPLKVVVTWATWTS
jgi:hypothetical protein